MGVTILLPTSSIIPFSKEGDVPRKWFSEEDKKVGSPSRTRTYSLAVNSQQFDTLT